MFGELSLLIIIIALFLHQLTREVKLNEHMHIANIFLKNNWLTHLTISMNVNWTELRCLYSLAVSRYIYTKDQKLINFLRKQIFPFRLQQRF